MNIEQLRDYCISKNGVSESFPFDDVTLVFKVAGKIFLLVRIDGIDLQFNIKCDPGLAVSLRETYDDVQPGYHMNKKHWNTIIANGSIPDKILYEWIDHSYALVFSSLPRKFRESL